MKRLVLTLCCVAGLLFAAPALAGTTYSTMSSWNGSDYLYPFGPDSAGQTSTYGQTIPGNGQALTSFVFQMQLDSDVVFRGAVATWDGSKAGTILWTSADRTTGGAYGSFTPVTFTIPGGVTLQSGQEYVIFATTVYSSQTNGSPDDGLWGQTADTFSNGNVVYFNTPNASDLTSSSWDGNRASNDFAFTANFGQAGGPLREARIMVCLSKAAPRMDGTVGLFQQLAADTWAAGVNDPASPYFRSTPAVYVQGWGTMCQLSDLATYGGDPAQYADAGYKVSESGVPTPEGVSALAWGAVYEYYAEK
jgi:hypothetical protein